MKIKKVKEEDKQKEESKQINFPWWDNQKKQNNESYNI